MHFSRPILLLLLFVSSPHAFAQWYSHSFAVMGTQAKVEFELGDEQTAQNLIQQTVAEMNRIDRLMSPYKADSELSQINQHASKQPLVISQELFDLLVLSETYSKLTNGAFDISFSSVGYLYDYRQEKMPNSTQIKSLKDAINYQKIIFDAKKQSVFFADPRIKIDLGGIAKGHAVDRCIEILVAAGVKNGYVNAGGDSRIIGRKSVRPWYIGIKHPRDPDQLIANLPLEDIALSTSGDYERFFVKDGVRYHHIIDPKTGDSARAIESATILAPDSTRADALSTSIFVLGVADGMALVNSLPDVSAIMVDRHGKMFLSKDLMQANK